jgi:alcohol dehydrogenase class IV
MTFEFATATRILFGPGVRHQAAEAARSIGRRALLITPRNAVQDSFLEGFVDTVPYPVRTEPTVPVIEEGVHLALASECDMVISVGGGSAIDAGKAIAALAANPGDLLDYLEVVGKGKPLSEPSLPFVAIPTAGTGSEVTRNAVIASPEHQVKASLRSPLMLPRLAAVDPELTLDLPPDLTAATGLDALAQVIEPFVCTKANPMTDWICREGIRHAAHSLDRAFHNGSDLEARTGMALASLCGGLALANAGLGAVHGFAAPIGGMFPAPHGAVCAALLAPVAHANLKALRKRHDSTPVLLRYREVARLLTGHVEATAEDGIEWLDVLVKRLHVPRLRSYGVTAEDLEKIAEKAAQASSMKANPVVLTHDEMLAVLHAAL